jgi:hypothetical protein
VTKKVVGVFVRFRAPLQPPGAQPSQPTSQDTNKQAKGKQTSTHADQHSPGVSGQIQDSSQIQDWSAMSPQELRLLEFSSSVDCFLKM